MQRGEGKTGESFQDGYEAIKMHRPKFQIIEHLKDLDVVNEKDADSDKQYVIEMMNEITSLANANNNKNIIEYRAES